jgi:RHS repeat-associated protein
MKKIAQRRWLIPFAFAGALMLVCGTPRICAQGNNYEGPIGVTGIFNGNITTGCSYDPLTHSAHREITDIVVPGSIGKYPLKMTRYYNSRSQYYANSPPDLNPAIGLGPGWAHEYSWLVWSAGHKVVSPHGNVYDDYCGPPVGVSEYWEGTRGETWRLADGGKVHFNGGQVDYIEDPYGLRTTIEYVNGRRWRVTEPGGRCLIFTYNTADPDGTSLLTKVEAYDYYNGHRIDLVSYTYTSKPSGGSGPNKMMLTGVSYSDGTSATYDYTTDNVPENGTSHKMYPLLQRCDDVRYNGPMRIIVYDYQNGFPHGFIWREKYPNIGPVSTISPGGPDTFIETRGDGPGRSFTYSHINHCQGEECPCGDHGTNGPDRQQMLLSYTDFEAHTTWLGYDSNWYVNSVTDARGSGPGDQNYTTNYTRGPATPQGIGQITRITHPGGDHIDYSYTGTNGGPWYVMTITDERGNKTIHARDTNHRITQTDYKDPSGNLLARETFTYCDQADSQCGPVNPTTGQMHAQIKRHQLKNGGYVHYRYDSQGRGLLIDQWEPTWNASAVDTDPKTHYDYYTSGPWTDRVMRMTLPVNVSGNVASETYEYDRAFDTNGITDLSGAAVAGRGLVTKITHADDTFQRFKYDWYGNKRWEDNELRKVTSYSYDNYNRLIGVARPLNGLTTYTYNPTNGGGGSPYLHTTSNPDTVTVRTSATTNIVTKNVYDENFRKTSSTAAYSTSKAATTWFHYDPVGNQNWVTDPRGTAGRTYPNGDPAYTTYTDYDGRNRKWRVREPLGRTTQFYYDDGFNLTRIIRPDSTTETKAYDGMNRLVTDTVPKETGLNIVTQFQYYPWNGGADGHSGSLLWTVLDGESHTTTFEYDASARKNKMIYPDNSAQAWDYDDAGNLASRTAVGGERQSFTYDNRNRKTAMSWNNGADWASFTYYADGRLWTASNANSVVTRTYDDAGRLTQDQQNVIGFATRNVTYPLYDDAGNLKQIYVPGVSSAYDHTFSYDEMGRFEKIFVTGGPLLFQYHYDPASNETQRDNLYSSVTEIYPRDELNRMKKMELQLDGQMFAREVYNWYPIGRLHTVTRHTNLQDQFVYYLDGELKLATYNVAATPPPTPTPTPTPTPPPGQVVSPTFRPDGAYYSACAYTYTFNVIISTTTSGARIRWTTDGNNWTDMGNGEIAAFSVGTGQTKTLQAYAYKSGMTNSNIHSANYTFERDCGQGPQEEPMAPDTIRTAAYNLDKAGNRTSVVDSISGTTTYSLNPNNLNEYSLVGNYAVTNGNEHHIIAYQSVAYTYINDERLTSAASGGNIYDLKYDALGRCVKRTLNGVTTYYFYDGEKPILEYDANGTLVGYNRYGKGIDEILQRIALGTAYFFQQDHQGSVTHLTSTTGAILEYYRYDVFGAPSIYAPNGSGRSSTIYDNRFLFTGREYAATYRSTYIPTFKFYEYRARAYHPGLGRFMSEDPKLFDPGDYNLFRYCHNDPLDLTDPMGLEGEAWLYRDVADRSSPGKYVLTENGKVRYTGRANVNGFMKDGHGIQTRGIPKGDYTLQPKQQDGVYKAGQPAITGQNLKPGQPTRDYQPDAVLVHEKGPPGQPDSKACVTLDREGVDRTKEVMDRNLDKGGTKFHVVEPTKRDSNQSGADGRTQKPSDASSAEQRAIQQGTKEAQDAASDVIHTKPHEQRQ